MRKLEVLSPAGDMDSVERSVQQFFVADEGGADVAALMIQRE